MLPLSLRPGAADKVFPKAATSATAASTDFPAPLFIAGEPASIYFTVNVADGVRT